MEIKKKRIQNLDAYLNFIKRRSRLVIGVKSINRFRSILLEAGFDAPIKLGDTILPDQSMGPVSRFNAQGKFIIHKNKRMETAYRMAEWRWEEWRGRYDREEKSKFVDIPYKRYPRTFIKPPSVELGITANTQGERLITSLPMIFIKPNEALILHTINLFLELFGECTIFSEGLDEIFKSPIRRLNWTVLPQGRWPWNKLQKELKPIVKNAPKGNRVLIEDRFKHINGYDPEFVAVGRAGFRGYVIFAFPPKDIYVLESVWTDNATYVFDQKWETLSQMTKAQVLNDKLQKARLIHRTGWHDKVTRLLVNRSKGRHSTSTP